MSSCVVISGHPDLEHSIANRAIVQALSASGADVEVRDLARLYPDYRIDVEAEQAALVAAERIVWQFPMHWYSVPAILKKWMDDVLTYGFAFGSTGDKLHGKELVVSATIGAPEDVYSPEGAYRHTVAELMRPLEQTARLIGVTYAPPILSYGMVGLTALGGDPAAVRQRAAAHAERLLAWVARPA